jgi:acyl carrier protein
MNKVAQMNDETLSHRLIELLVEVAPDVEPTEVKPDRDFRDQFDFDSMDLFNYATAIHQAFGVDIPERDYARLLSIEKAAEYLRVCR